MHQFQCIFFPQAASNAAVRCTMQLVLNEKEHNNKTESLSDYICFDLLKELVKQLGWKTPISFDVHPEINWNAIKTTSKLEWTLQRQLVQVSFQQNAELCTERKMYVQ